MATGLCAVSTAALFIRLSLDHIDPLPVAAWRLAVSSLVLWAYVVARGQVPRPPRQVLGLCALAGVALAVHFMTWVSSLDLTTVAASTTLVATYPLMVAVASPLILRETPRRLVLVAVIVGMVGIVLIALDSGNPLSGDIAGNALALAGAAAAAVYFLFGRSVRPRLPLLAFISIVYGIAALVLVPVALASGTRVLPDEAEGYLWLILLALVPQLVGHSSFNYALGHLPASFVTLVILGEPVLSTLLAVVFLDEIPGPWVYAGMAVLFAAILVASLDEQRRLRSTALPGPEGAPLASLPSTQAGSML